MKQTLHYPDKIVYMLGKIRPFISIDVRKLIVNLALRCDCDAPTAGHYNIYCKSCASFRCNYSGEPEVCSICGACHFCDPFKLIVTCDQCKNWICANCSNLFHSNSLGFIKCKVCLPASARNIVARKPNWNYQTGFDHSHGFVLNAAARPSFFDNIEDDGFKCSKHSAINPTVEAAYQAAEMYDEDDVDALERLKIPEGYNNGDTELCFNCGRFFTQP